MKFRIENPRDGSVEHHSAIPGRDFTFPGIKIHMEHCHENFFEVTEYKTLPRGPRIKLSFLGKTLYEGGLLGNVSELVFYGDKTEFDLPDGRRVVSE